MCFSAFLMARSWLKSIALSAPCHVGPVCVLDQRRDGTALFAERFFWYKNHFVLFPRQRQNLFGRPHEAAQLPVLKNYPLFLFVCRIDSNVQCLSYLQPWADENCLVIPPANYSSQFLCFSYPETRAQVQISLFAEGTNFHLVFKYWHKISLLQTLK